MRNLEKLHDKLQVLETSEENLELVNLVIELLTEVQRLGYEVERIKASDPSKFRDPII